MRRFILLALSVICYSGIAVGQGGIVEVQRDSLSDAYIRVDAEDMVMGQYGPNLVQDFDEYLIPQKIVSDIDRTRHASAGGACAAARVIAEGRGGIINASGSTPAGVG
ncbi:MAG: hypothetical protein MI861_10800 [Pirellulales bacterium]|nr:hypothetical protein [Pirellulales bacterium]